MHTQQWIHHGRKKTHQIQLLHLFKTKEVLLKLNGAILHFDQFDPLKEQEKQYPFFVDGELCEVKIQQKNKQYIYQFIPHPYSTSKIGKTKKFREKMTEWSIGLGMLFIITLVIIPLLYNISQHFNSKENLALGGMLSTGIITHLVSSSDTNSNNTSSKTPDSIPYVNYKFPVRNRWYYGTSPVQQTSKGSFITESGLPLEMGSEFSILFTTDNPKKNEILFDQPSLKQVEQYQLKALEACLLHPPAHIDTINRLMYCSCLVSKIEQKHQLPGLMTMIFQEEEIQKYQTFIQAPPQKEMIQNCQTEVANSP